MQVALLLPGLLRVARNDAKGHAPRALLIATTVGLLLCLAGCGWTPLYADPATEPADVELRAIRVLPIPERIGQRLALALRDSFNPNGTPVPQQHYTLNVTLQTVRQDLGVTTQGIGTRGRLDVNANYVLREIRSGAPVLQGSSHVAESFDIVANEYSTIVAEDDARIRAVEELRRDLVTRLAVFLQRRAVAVPPAPPPAPLPGR